MSGIDPKVDFVFKLLFGTVANADLLIDLLNAVLALPADRAVVAVEFLNPFNDKEAVDDKLSILDIKARDSAGRHYNVEMQMEPFRAYPARVLYYLTRMHQKQLREGVGFADLAPSYSISFLDHVLYPDRPRWHWQFQLRDLNEPALLFSDQLTVHVVELPKFKRSATEISTEFERWCYFLQHGEELEREHLPEPLRRAPFQKALEVLHMVTQDELEYERYEARMKFRLEQLARLREAREDGEAIGEKRGKEIGEKRGELIGRIKVYAELLKLAPTPSATLDAMTLEQLTELVGGLSKQLTEPHSPSEPKA